MCSREMNNFYDTVSAKLCAICAAASGGATGPEIIAIAEALRTSTKPYIILPRESGVGWCRLVSSSPLEKYAEKCYGGYRIDTEGDWMVCSSDGLGKKSAVWTVRRIGNVWIAN